MKTFHKWIILCALLVAALASYSYGFSAEAFAFVGLGVAFELLFWFKVFSKSSEHS
jgi:hypothetical protein